MLSQLVQLSFDKIMQTKSYTVIILGTPEKRFAIYTEPSVGKILQFFLTDVERPRPLTHDILERIFDGMDIQVKQVVINDVQNTIYYARLFLEQERGNIRQIVEIDIRPSDALILALKMHAPVYCTQDVLNKVIPVEE
jgi:uncharacterized protein